MPRTLHTSLVLVLLIFATIRSSAFSPFGLRVVNLSSSSIAYTEHNEEDIVPAKRFDLRRGLFDPEDSDINWSTTESRPYTNRYVKARRTGVLSADEDVDEELLSSVEDRKSKKRRLAWISARKEEEQLGE